MHNRKRRTPRRSALLAAFALIAALLPFDVPGSPLTAADAGPPPVETYIVPLPEEDIRGGSLALYASTHETVHTIISITGAIDDTIVYYDHWEDGFELDLSNPVQTTTETWGDGLLANGAPPGTPDDASDTFGAGDNAALINDVFANPRNQLDVLYDGGDRIGATGPIAVTRAGWALDPGTLLAGAVEVYPTEAWGTSYEVPMGEDSPLGENFEYTAASIMAATAGTTVNVDTDADTIVDQTVNLGAGESVLIDGLNQGATITANGPIQVELLTGDVGATYAGRWYALLPLSQWANSYFNPVGTSDAGAPSTVVLYNPGASALVVDVDHQTGSTTVNVPSKGVATYTMPASGAQFSALSAFYATVVVDYGNTASDWGFTLVPETRLTTAAVVGWGPGSNDLALENSSPVWVTAEGATTIYVDYDGDPTTGLLTDGDGNSYDVDYSLAAFQMQLLLDNSDFDQTGLKVYTLDGTRIAVAYGQDPATASGGVPALDLGTAVVPLVLVALGKIGSLSGDTNANGALDPGEFITYTVTIRNDGTATINPAMFSDDLDSHTTYVPGTTTVDGVGYADAGATPFPFDEGGADLGAINPGQLVVITYTVQLADPLADGVDSIVNSAQLNSMGISVTGTSVQPVFDPYLEVTKTSDVSATGAIPGDTITYTVVVENISDTPQDGFSVTDAVPQGTTYVAESTSVTGPVASISTYADDMESGGYGGSTGSLFWGPDWTEINESDGANAGDEQVINSGGSLRMRVQDNDGGGEGVSRALDLSGYDTATLSLDFARSGFDGATDFVTLEATDGGGSWDTLETWVGPGSDPVFLPTSYSLDSYRTAGAAIRFVTSPTFGASDLLMFDNVVVAAATFASGTRTNAAADPSPLGDGATPNLVVPTDPFALAPGETLTIIYQVQVDDPLLLAITELTNTAYAASSQQPIYVTDSVTDPIAYPEVALDKVLLVNADEDGSGDVTVADTLTYRFTAVNTGDTALVDVEITDPMSGLSALSCSPIQPASLAIGESLVCTATYSVVQADVNASRIDNTASVVGSDPAGRPVTDTAIESVPINQVPAITLTKSLQTDLAGIVSGDTFDYDFVVTNPGNVDLTNVVLSDPLLGGTVSCPQTALSPNESMTCNGSYIVTQTDVDTGQIANTGTVVADEPGGGTVTDSDDELAILEQNPSIGLIKNLQTNADEDSSGGISLSDTLTYQFVATNDGNVTLNNVMVADPLPGLSAVACVPLAGSSLAPTEQMTCTATYSVTQSDVDAGVIDNTATATGESVTGADVSDDASESVSTTQDPSIALTKSLAGNADEDLSGDVTLNDTLTYLFEVVNDGDVTLTAVTLTDPLPGLSALSCGADVLPITMAPGATVSCTATYSVTQPNVDAGRIDNTATATGLQPNGLPISDDDDETVLPDRNPSIDLTKTLLANADEDASGDVSLDDTLTYQFVATNDGDVGLDNVTVTDPLAGLSALVCIPATGASLATTESMTCLATYVVTQGDVDAGEIVNTATAIGDDSGGGGSVTDQDSVTTSTAQNPSIGLIKSYIANADEDGSGDVSLADTLTYELVVDNSGDVTLTNVAVDDPLTGGAVSCPFTTLAPGASMTCLTSYVVVQSDIDAGSISNTATVTGDDPGGTPVTDDDDELVGPPQNPSIVLVKTLLANGDDDGSGDLSVGDTLTYQFVATNDGDVTLDLAEITDPKPGMSALSCAPVAGSSLATGSSMSCTAIYVTTQGDVDAGIIDNTATVTAEHPGGDPGDPGDDITDDDDLSVLIPAEPAIQLIKTMSGNADEDASGDVSVGDTLSYEFLVENTGNVTLNSVGVTDALVGTVSCPITALAPGGTTTCTATHVVDLADADTGAVINTATATGTDPNDTDVSDDDTVSTPVVTNPAITLVKSLQSNADEDGSGGISISDTLSYGFVATNTGDVTLSAVRVVDPLVGLSALSCVPSQPAVLAPGEAITCAATYSVTQLNVDHGQILNTAVAEGLAPDSTLVSDIDDVTVPIAPNASITLDKFVSNNADEDASGGITRDDTLTYQFEATNSGNVTLSAVAISDPLAGLGALACNPAQPAVLLPGETLVCTAEYVVLQTDVDATEITNTATVNGVDPSSNPVVDTDTVVTPIASNPSITLDKSLASNADEDGTGDVSEGDTLTYQFDVVNDGDVSLSNVTVTDPLSGLSAIACSPAQGSTLLPTETMSCTATYSVTSTDIAVGQVDNTATVVGLAPAGTPTSDTDSETVMTARADLSLFKSVSDSTPNVGQPIVYILSVVNDGPDTATNVTVTDHLPVGVAYSAGSIAGGDTRDDSGAPTLSWTIGTMSSGSSTNLTYTAVMAAPTGAPDEYFNTAEVTASDTFDPDSTPDNDDGDQSEDDEDSAVVAPQSADLSLVKTVSDANPNVGDTVTFTVTVANAGGDDASGVAVADAVPAGYSNMGAVSHSGLVVGSSVVWSGLAVAAGGSVVLSFTAEVGASGSYVNVAEVTAADQLDPDSTPANDDGDQSEDDEDSAVVVPQEADLSLVKTVSEATPNVGDTVSFSVVVANAGPGNATAVSITDSVPVGYSGISNVSSGGSLVGSTISWTGLAIADGATETVTFDAVVVAPTGAVDEYRNTAQVAAADQIDPDSTPNNDDGDQSEDDEDDAVVVPLEADLSLVKAVSDSTPLVDQVVTFTLTVTNAGPDDATGVALSDLVPNGYRSISNVSDSGVAVGNTVSWTALAIPNGGSISVTFDATVEAPPTAYLNIAEVTASDQFDPDSTPGNDDGDQSEDDEDNVGLFPTNADLELSKTVSAATPNVGDTVAFTITVVNNGPDDATGVSVADVVPGGYSSISNISSGGVLAGSTITWSGLTLTSGGSVDLTFDAVVDAPTGAANEYRNTAEVIAADQYDDDSTPNNDDGDQSEDDEDNAVVVPQHADLSLTKIVSNSTPGVGEIVMFTITVSNAGPDIATGVVVTDALPAGYSYQPGSISGGDTQDASADPSLSWGITSLAVAASVDLTFLASVQAPSGTVDEFLNVAEVVAADQLDSDSTPGNDDGDQSEDDEDNAVVVPVVIDLDLTKIVSDSTPNVGDTVTFTITVANRGPSDASGVEITDSIPTGYTAISNVSGGGAFVSPSVTWTGLSVPAGGSVDLTFDAAVVAPPVDYLNVVEVTAADQYDSDSTPGNDDGDQSEDDEDSALVVPQEADLSLVKTVSDATPNVGDTVTFSITVANAGPDDATSVAVDDVVPAGYSGISNISSSGALAGSTISWTGLSIAVGATETVTFEAVVVSPAGAVDEYRNTAQVVAADQFDSDSVPDNDDGDQSEDDEDDAAAVPQIADLRLAKSVDDPTPTSGSTVTFSVSVTNDGPADATDVAVSDSLPSGLSGISAISHGGTQTGTTITWTGLTIATGATVDLTFDAVVAAPNGAADQYLNTAQVVAATQFDPDSVPDNDDGDQSEDDEDNADVVPAVIGLAKSVTGVVNHGDGSYTVTYLLTAENLGDVVISDLEIIDDVVTQFAALAPTSFLASDGSLVASSTWDGGASSNVLAGGQALDPAETGTVHISLTVIPGAATGPHDNVAFVTGITPSGGTVDDDSTDGIDPDTDGDDGDGTFDDDDVPDEDTPTPVDFSEAPLLGIAKIVTAGPVANGDGSYDVSYELYAENMGDVALSGIQITDDLAATFATVGDWSLREIASDTLTTSPTFDGISDTQLLAGTDALAVGQSATVQILITVTPGDDLGPHWNSAIVSGSSPASTSVVDISHDGLDPDPDGNGDPADNNDPTPVLFPDLGSVTGLVWNDANADGLLDTAENGVAGVVVELVDPGPDGVIGGADDIVIATTTTAADGSYGFEDVPAGDYGVVVDQSTLPWAALNTYDPDGVLNGMTAVTVVAGAEAGANDFGYVGRSNLRLAKTATGEAEAGASVDFLITVTNDGPAAALGPITVTDIVPALLSISEVFAADWECTVTGQVVECVLDGDLAAGASSSIEVTTLTSERPSADVRNTATVAVTGPVPDLDPTDNEDTAIVPVTELPRTGSDLLRLAVFGLLMLAAGAAMVTLAKRREEQQI